MHSGHHVLSAGPHSREGKIGDRKQFRFMKLFEKQFRLTKADRKKIVALNLFENN
jgi:hypothetical protein